MEKDDRNDTSYPEFSSDFVSDQLDKFTLHENSIWSNIDQDHDINHHEVNYKQGNDSMNTEIFNQRTSIGSPMKQYEYSTRPTYNDDMRPRNTYTRKNLKAAFESNHILSGSCPIEHNGFVDYTKPPKEFDV